MKRNSPIANPFRAGFTLLEIMLVVMIIALLAGIAILKMGGTLEEASITKAKTQLQQFDLALLNYRSKAGFYPTTEQGLKALIFKPSTEPVPRNWVSITKKPLAKDPWEMDYVYQLPGKHNPDGYDLYSAGPDRTPGTADDIGNWESAS